MEHKVNSKLLIFDFDGTLYESLEVNYKSINQALRKLGIPYEVDREMIRGHLGETAAEFYGHILREDVMDRWEEVRIENRRITGEMAAEYAKAFPGVVSGLKVLKERGYKLALYSNCSPTYLEIASSAIGVKGVFDYIECVGQNNLNKIQLVKKIREHFDNLPAAVVGDKSHDIEAAKANNCVSIGVLYGYGKDEPYGADITINNFEDLTNIFI